MGSLGNKAFKGAFWVAMQRFCTQFVAFFVTLVLARLLTPSDYGAVALLGVFTNVAAILVDSGLGMALIQKKDASEIDFNSLFYASLTIAAVCYGILFAAAPFVARIYNMPELKWMLRLVSISLIFSAMNSVQGAELTRKMLFNLSFKVSLFTSGASAIAGVTLACMGCGPWTIAWQGVIRGFVSVVANWFIVAWRPKLMFSFKALKGLFSFGWKVSSVSVIYSLYMDAYTFLIGKCYSKEDLAFVNKGRGIPTLAMATISSTICGVSFPALAQMQDDRPRVRMAVRRMMLTSTFLVFPLMMGVAVCADDLVYVLFGAKWLPCVPYMRLACFSLSLQPLHDINLQCIAALGRGDVFLKLQLIKTALGFLLMAVFLQFSVLAFMASLAIVSGPTAYYINAWHNKEFIGYSFWDQVKDLIPSVFRVLLMGGIVFLVGFFFPDGLSVPFRIAKLFVQAGVGLVVCFMLSWVAKDSGLAEYLKIVLPRLPSRLNGFSRIIERRFAVSGA